MISDSLNFINKSITLYCLCTELTIKVVVYIGPQVTGDIAEAAVLSHQSISTSATANYNPYPNSMFPVTESSPE